MSSPIKALVKSNPYVRLIIGVLRLYIIIYTCTYTSTYLRTQCKSTACTSSFILKKIQFATVWYCVLELIHSNELDINYIFIGKKKIWNHNRSHKKISVNYSEGANIFLENFVLIMYVFNALYLDPFPNKAKKYIEGFIHFITVT